MKSIEQLWDMVNSANTLDKIAIAEKELSDNTNISNEQFDELMKTLSYLSREIYRRNR